MGTATFVQNFKDALEFRPVEGQPNLFLIHLRGGTTEPSQEKMTPEAWNEFESHIGDMRGQ